jgi:hypothetical protein
MARYSARYKGHKFTVGEKVVGVGVIGQAMTIDYMVNRKKYPKL